jgi:hypothetical protein
MSYIIKSGNSDKLLPKMRAIGAYEVYLNQVKSAIDPIRYKNLGLAYIPPQLGGLSGQRKVIEQELVMQVIDFEVN